MSPSLLGMQPLKLAVLTFICAALSHQAFAAKLLVISVDGLDQRYLRDADKAGLRIPHIRRFIREGWSVDGVVGVVPTVTWPSHTSIITGVPPAQHGILGNRRPASEGGEYYWNAALLKVPTLLDAVRQAGLKSAAITWPVTVDAPVDYNLPEYFAKRNGGGMDLHSIESKGTPGLVARIAAMYPSFAQEWMDDRTRALATMYLLREPKPDLILVHFVDHDSEAHETGPFSREANAKIEYTDELLGSVLGVLPKEYVVALVSDHGFERTDATVNFRTLLEPVAADCTVTPFLLIAKTQAAAERIRVLAREPKHGIGREIEGTELRQLAPSASAGAVAAWEPAPHHSFTTSNSAELHSKPRELGNHGFWPTRQDYRSVFVLWGKGIKPGKQGEMKMIDIAARLASIVEVPYPFTKK